MATCPRGHPSSDDEYCDVCGTRIAPAPAPAHAATGGPPTPAAPDAQGGPEPAGDAGAERCPRCKHPRVANFCEQCGYNFAAGAAPGDDDIPGDTTRPAPPELTGEPATAAPAWVAVVGADRAYFDKVVAEGGPDAGSVAFPPYNPQRHVLLTGSEVRIGRSSRSRPANPEINLGEPPRDPGVSHLHAVLLAQPDGTWSLVDPGSINGTLVNGTAVEINVPVPLGSGDRIHLGAWTVITVCERDAAEGAPGEGGTP